MSGTRYNQVQQMQAAQAKAEAQARYLAHHLVKQEFTEVVGDVAITINGLGQVTNIAMPDEDLAVRLAQAWTEASKKAQDYAISKSGGNFPDVPMNPIEGPGIN